MFSEADNVRKTAKSVATKRKEKMLTVKGSSHRSKSLKIACRYFYVFFVFVFFTLITKEPRQADTFNSKPT